MWLLSPAIPSQRFKKAKLSHSVAQEKTGSEKLNLLKNSGYWLVDSVPVLFRSHHISIGLRAWASTSIQPFFQCFFQCQLSITFQLLQTVTNRFSDLKSLKFCFSDLRSKFCFSDPKKICVSQTKFGSPKAVIFLFAHHLQGTCWIKCRRWDLMALFAQLCQLPWDLRLNL